VGTVTAVAVIPVRGGVLPLGADEAVAEAGGVALLVGDGTFDAASALLTASESLGCAEVGAFAAGAWARAVAPAVEQAELVLLPASPDGRDLAPRLAHVLGRPLWAGAVRVSGGTVVVGRSGGLVMEEHRVDGPIVATLEPGVRGFVPAPFVATPQAVGLTVSPGTDARVVEVLPPDPATVDLAEADRIIAGGAGLGGPEPFELLREVGVALGAAWGASRVAADAGWVPGDRFIGTTGVSVDPELYLAFGISGAVQHVTGLGRPEHVVAINTDAACPMVAMSDLAIITDARQLLKELADRLGVAGG
jgi:electron transfer flavoprotein alpha subunit